MPRAYPMSWDQMGTSFLFLGPTRRMLSFQLCQCVFSSPKLLASQLIVTPVGLGWCMVDQTSRYRTLRYETEIATYRRRRSDISLSLLRTPSLLASRFYLYLFNAGHNIPWYLTLDMKLSHVAHGMSLLHCKKNEDYAAYNCVRQERYQASQRLAHLHLCMPTKTPQRDSSHDPTNNLAMIPDTLLSNYPARLGRPYYCTCVSICFFPPCRRPRFHNLWRPIDLCPPRIVLISVQQ